MQILGLYLKDNARTLSGLVLIGLLAAVLHLGMQWLSDPYRFPLNVVEVKGDFRYLDRGQLQQAIAHHADDGFFTVDVAAVCAAAEQLPWVYRAKVQRVWPDILRLQIDEQEPIARWGEQGFLNRFGESFIPGETVVAGELPGLAGPAGLESRVLEQYQLAAGLLAPLGMQVSRLEIDGRRALHVQLEGGVQLELGRVNAWQRLQRFVRAYPAVFDGRMNELQRVDLRYSNGFSVYWQEAAPVDAGEKQV
jgi:cell division protein FtsQ